MQFKQIKRYIPVPTVIFFVIWGNSSYAPAVRNVGFYCDDESIKKPFHGDSVHFISLLTVLLGLVPVIMYTSDLLAKGWEKDDDFPKGNLRILLRIYYSGFLFVLGFTEALKLSYSELRPHFFTTCQPDMENIKCSDGFITEFNCTGKGWEDLLGRDIYKSFPSGHASLSTFSCVFLNIYLYLRMGNGPDTTRCGRWWFRSILATSLLWTVSCCMSRIFDNRHFWWDVVTGFLIGSAAGVVAIAMAVDSHVVVKKSISSTR